LVTRDLPKFADVAQHKFSAEQYPTVYLALPALEGLHAAWFKHLTPNTGYDAFQRPLAAGVAKIAEYYNQTEDSDVYIMSMGICLFVCTFE
jgi:hypothetical protein